MGGLAGWLPDADVLIRSAADPLLAIEQHRGFTHALVFTPAGAALASAKTHTFSRPFMSSPPSVPGAAPTAPLTMPMT